MINRGNWQLIRAYLKYRAEVDQVSPKTLRLEETWLRHVLEWADYRSFDSVTKIKPMFPEYMLTARLDGEEGRLSSVYIKKVIGASKRFFSWLIKNRQGYNHKIKPAWIDSLKSPRLPDDTKEHEAVTLEEIRAIAYAPVETIRDRRIRAAAVFWFLSGIRVGAFVTLPIKAIDLDNLTVYQWPSYGVKTKFGKKGTTYILNIPDLLEVIKAWDQEVRAVLPGNAYWFAALSPDTGSFDPNITQAGEHRYTRASKDLRDWLYRVGLPYHSPHKFRHGHAVYALKQAKNVGQLKAVSQNLMHRDLKTTDGIYGLLSEMDTQQKIASLGESNGEMRFSQEELDYIAEVLAKKLKQEPL